MHLEIVLPCRLLVDVEHVARIVAESAAGSFGIRPRRLDCVAALVPGLLAFETHSGEETFVAIDEGTLVKEGASVRVAVRRAVCGTDPEALHAAVEREFLRLDEDQRRLRRSMAGLESGFIRRMAEVHRD